MPWVLHTSPFFVIIKMKWPRWDEVPWIGAGVWERKRKYNKSLQVSSQVT
jgi:hypothetical protein